MTSGNKEVNRFLGQSDICFVIPVYQRDYSWQEEQCEQLMEDIINIINKDESHFIGEVHIKPEGRHSCIVIDGQQRITTLLLLLKIIHDLTNNNLLKDKIFKRYLTDEYLDCIKLKLKSVKRESSIFNKLIKNNKFDESLFDAEEQSSNIYRNYIYMRDVLCRDINDGLYTVEEFEDAVERLSMTESVLVDNDNPQIIFEHLNNTGIPLTDSDLLRNYFLMALKDKDQEILFNNYWSKIEECLNNDNHYIDYFLMYFLITKKRNGFITYAGKNTKITRKRLYYYFKKEYPFANMGDPVVVEKILKEILQYAKYYKRFIFNRNTVRENLNNIDKLVYDLVYSLNNQHSVIVLLYLFNKLENHEITEVELENIIRALISLTVRAKICEKKQCFDTQYYASIIQRLDKCNGTNDFVKDLWYIITDSTNFPRDTEFKNILKTKPIYSSFDAKTTKYILYELEKATNPKETPAYSDGTIEHIMPQNLNADWENDLNSKNDLNNHDLFLHRLGNLTLTGYNSELSNMSFDKKKKEYAKSNYANTRNIIKYTGWSSNEIEERGEELAELCLKTWNLPSEFSKINKVNLNTTYDLQSNFVMFTSTKPNEITFLNQTKKVTSWIGLITFVLECCYNYNKQTFSLLPSQCFLGKNKRYFSTISTNMQCGIEIPNSGIYADIGKSDIIVNLKLLKNTLEFLDSQLNTTFVDDVKFTLSKV